MKDEAKAAPISKVRFVKHFFAFGAMNGRMRYSSMHLFPSLAFLRMIISAIGFFIGAAFFTFRPHERHISVII